jgi:Cof subfamily protein (haloacid dehalogenase superfamily)
MKGIIASDIDRTLTNRNHEIPKDVIKYLKKRHLDGFEIVFLTGRPFCFSKSALFLCDFSYHLGVQNGAEVLFMPKEEFCMQNFLPKETVLTICSICLFNDRDFIVATGVENNDEYYYVAENFSGEAKAYMDNVIGLAITKFKKCQSFEELYNLNFPLMRSFGTLEEMIELKKLVLAKADVNCVILHDITISGMFIMLITALGVDKGSSLKRLIKKNNWTGKVICCGDDLNDISLFEASDISIGMANGHKDLLKKATIIAKPSDQMGVIDAIDIAIGMINDR